MQDPPADAPGARLGEPLFVNLSRRPPTKTARILRSTQRFFAILGSFESAESQLSNEPRIAKNGSVDRKIWTFFVGGLMPTVVKKIKIVSDIFSQVIRFVLRSYAPLV